MREKKAATGFEPVNGGFADRSLNHLGTPPQDILSIPINVRADTMIQVTYLSWPQIAICPVAYRLPVSQWIREQAVHGRDGLGAAGQPCSQYAPGR